MQVIATVGVAIPIFGILAMFVVVCSYRERFRYSVPIGPPEDGMLLIVIPMATYIVFSGRLSTVGFGWFAHWGGGIYFPFLALVTMVLLRRWGRTHAENGEVLQDTEAPPANMV
jgi:hypothetical protein